MRAPKENSPEARTYMGTEMEKDAGPWLRHPMRRHRSGVEFNLGRGQTGGILVSGMPRVHAWDGSEWVLPDYSPKIAYDGSVIFRPLGGVRWSGDVFHGLDGRSVTLRSAGVLDKGLYRPLWRAGPLQASPFLLRQTVGPFEHEVHITQASVRSEVHIREFPSLPGGDALAFEFCADRMLPPEQCPCHPWYQDAKGHRADVTKLRWLGGRYEYIPLTDLERLTFPIVIDPETNTVGFACGGLGFDVAPYLDARNLLAGSAFTCLGGYGTQALGQQYTGGEPTGFWVWRMYNGWDASGGCGIITAADVKADCSSINAYADEDFYFKHFDGAGRACAGADCQQMFLDTDTTGTTIIATMAELQAVGCAVGTWGPYHALNAADITHLNDHYGLGNPLGWPLYWGVQSKEDYDSSAPAFGDNRWFISRRDYYLRYTADSCGGYIWLVGG
jgi:hypothetical protein